jgi:FtsH-binding integral membrane protein
MADLRNYQGRVQTGEMIDQGLRTYMLKVYNLMAMGLAITGIGRVSSRFHHSPPLRRPC